MCVEKDDQQMGAETWMPTNGCQAISPAMNAKKMDVKQWGPNDGVSPILLPIRQYTRLISQSTLSWPDYVGPLLDDWLKGGTPKALKGLSSVVTLVSVCMYVCLSVCDQATGHSFRPSKLIF